MNRAQGERTRQSPQSPSFVVRSPLLDFEELCALRRAQRKSRHAACPIPRRLDRSTRQKRLVRVLAPLIQQIGQPGFFSRDVGRLRLARGRAADGARAAGSHAGDRPQAREASLSYDPARCTTRCSTSSTHSASRQHCCGRSQSCPLTHGSQRGAHERPEAAPGPMIK